MPTPHRLGVPMAKIGSDLLLISSEAEIALCLPGDCYLPNENTTESNILFCCYFSIFVMALLGAEDTLRDGNLRERCSSGGGTSEPLKRKFITTNSVGWFQSHEGNYGVSIFSIVFKQTCFWKINFDFFFKSSQILMLINPSKFPPCLNVWSTRIYFVGAFPSAAKPLCPSWRAAFSNRQ